MLLPDDAVGFLLGLSVPLWFHFPSTGLDPELVSGRFIGHQSRKEAKRKYGPKSSLHMYRNQGSAVGKGLLKIKTQPNSQSRRISKQEVPVSGLWLFSVLSGNPFCNATDAIILPLLLTGWGRDLRFICIELAHHPRLFSFIYILSENSQAHESV